MTESGEDAWEICNDDGFVYRRRKRPRSVPNPSDPPAAEDVVQEAEMKRRRLQRKKATLLKLKRDYIEEIQQWEAIEARIQHMESFIQEDSAESSRSPEAPVDRVQMGNDDVEGKLIDELILEVEAQEKIIQSVSQLCDVAEAICHEEEERQVQNFVDLPVWASPRALMASVSQADDGESTPDALAASHSIDC